MPDNPFRLVPAVAKVLDLPAVADARTRHPHAAVADAVRAEVDALRSLIAAGHPINGQADPDALAARVVARLELVAKPQLRPVLNTTGIVLHTNLGRSPMAEPVAQAAYSAARGYLNLEMSLATGKRSSRQDPIRDGVKRITGADAATVVNNCAAATVIVLRALAMGKEVIVSRGQLIEIGGSFRIPDIMTVSGATLREVGTTNITRIGDYEKAIGPNTGLLMRIHTSNYRVRGFTKEATIDELVALGKKHNIPVVDDAGSGVAVDLSAFGLPGEPVVSEGIAAGADLVLFSGDKLLGGPQAGIIAGKAPLIQKIEKDPLMRAFRLDKMTLAALEATLLLYRDPAKAIREVPTLRMLATPLTELRERCRAFAARLLELPTLDSVEVTDDVAYVGGGSLPDVAVPTCVVAVVPKGMSEEAFAERLRTGTPAVVGRVQGGRWLLDLRTVFAEQEDELLAAIRAASLVSGL
ncbi:MAG: L-seryl-tRNA(Sec) selenium transferase [Fimbriiglobus sp.]|nr:L-seryl-tRNA(Sec) selenium transferase [Fimbriiglobus sp.]